MEIRSMKKLGIDMPLLGMGLMRLPMKDGDIDLEHATKMVDTMYEAGVRYFDTAYVYGDGQSERFAKAALTDRYPRDSFCIATKLPLDEEFLARKEEVFAESCSRLGVDYVDFYLLHAMGAKRWETVKQYGADKFQRQLKAEGKVRYIGFSFHDSPEALRAILEDQPDWDFVQIQLNYLDWYRDRANELYETLSEYNIPIIVMEPVRGSHLIELGDDVREVFTQADPEASNARWAMRWVGSLPNVNVVLSGVSTLEQAQENAQMYSPLVPVTDSEQQTIRKVVDIVVSRPHVPCTGCNYCKDCPAGIPIPRIFHAANMVTQLNTTGWPLNIYFSQIDAEHNASACLNCGACVEHCPQHIDVPARLAECHELMCGVRDGKN